MYFVKINHLLRQGWEKNNRNIYQLSCCCTGECAFANKSDLPVDLRFHLTCIEQSNFKFCSINYKFSLNIRVKAPNKKLTCIQLFQFGLVLWLF